MLWGGIEFYETVGGPGAVLLSEKEKLVPFYPVLIILNYRCIKWSQGEESLCINNFFVIDNSYNVQTFIEFQVFLPYPFYNPLLPNYRKLSCERYIFRDFLVCF